MILKSFTSLLAEEALEIRKKSFSSSTEQASTNA